MQEQQYLFIKIIKTLSLLIKEKTFTIRRENEIYVVESEWLYRVMGSINFDDHESLAYFQKVLRNNGVFKALEDRGVKDGDTVSIYDFEFEYIK